MATVAEHQINSWHGTHIQECSCGEVFYAFTRSESVDKSLRHLGSELAFDMLASTAERMRARVDYT